MVLHWLASKRLKIDRPFDGYSSESVFSGGYLVGRGNIWNLSLEPVIFHLTCWLKFITFDPFRVSLPSEPTYPKTSGSLSLLDNNSRGFTNSAPPPWIIHEDSRIFNRSEGDQRIGERLLRERSRSNDRAQTPTKLFRSFVSYPRFWTKFSHQICVLYWLMEITILSTGIWEFC